MTDQRDRQRIAELEAEVAALRGQVAQQAPAEAEHDPSARSAAASELPADAAPDRAQRLKIVGLSTVLVIVAVSFFLALYTALSKGFDSLADKAAKGYSAGFDGTGDPARPEAPGPAGKANKAPLPPPRVPGL